MDEAILGVGWLALFAVLGLAAQRWAVDTRDGFAQPPKQVLR